MTAKILVTCHMSYSISCFGYRASPVVHDKRPDEHTSKSITMLWTFCTNGGWGGDGGGGGGGEGVTGFWLVQSYKHAGGGLARICLSSCFGVC